MQFSNDYENTLDTDRKKLQIDMSHLGISTHPGRHQLQELRAAISRGGKNIELGWFGTGKGSIGQGNLNPEMHSHEEREAMRELAKINKVQLSTHASPNMGYLSGLTKEGFSREQQERVKLELDRAIHFAADVAEGGPVVVHVGEFQRPVFEAERRFGSKDEYFESMAEEEKKAPFFLVDKESGKMTGISRAQKLHIETGETDNYGMKEFKAVPVYEIIEQKQKEVGFEKAPVAVYKELVEKEIENLAGESKRAAIESEKLMLRYEHDMGVLKGLKEGDLNAAKKAQAVLEASGMNSKDLVKGMEILAERTKSEADSNMQIANSRKRQLLESKENLANKETIYEYGIRESAKAIAEEAVKAYKVEKSKGLKQPLWLALENWDPDTYGNHPRELRELILKSREQMVNKLVNEQKVSEGQAEKIAEDHIKATFDIGHANFWRKYYKGDPADFGKWLIKEVKELQKDNIIGHVHLSDNFGWHDEHLTPGAGNAPIQEFVEEIVKGKDWKGRMIIEPGGQPEGLAWTAMPDTWRQLNTPIYRIDGSPQSWTDIQTSYVNQVVNPTAHIVGEYVPFKDWSSWSSEIPLE